MTIDNELVKELESMTGGPENGSKTELIPVKEIQRLTRLHQERPMDLDEVIKTLKSDRTQHTSFIAYGLTRDNEMPRYVGFKMDQNWRKVISERFVGAVEIYFYHPGMDAVMSFNKYVPD